MVGVVMLLLAQVAEPSATSTPPASVVAPAPSQSTERPRLILLDLGNSGVDPNVVRVLSDTLSTPLTSGPFSVTSSADLRAVVGLKADTQLAGCAIESSACEAELASALGADVLVHGSVGILDDELVVNLAMFDSHRNVAISREKVQDRKLVHLNKKVETAAARMIARYEGRVPPPPLPDSDAAGWAVPLLSAGSVLGVLGGCRGRDRRRCRPWEPDDPRPGR